MKKYASIEATGIKKGMEIIIEGQNVIQDGEKNKENKLIFRDTRNKKR